MIFSIQSFAGASSSLPQIPGSDSLQLRPTGVTTTSSSTHHSKQHAKVSPYIPKQEHLGAPSEKDNKHRGARSPKVKMNISLAWVFDNLVNLYLQPFFLIRLHICK